MMRRPYLITLFSALFGFLLAFYFFALPYLVRLRPRWDLSSYDWGLQGVYPTQDYVSFPWVSPLVSNLRWDARCAPGFIFLTPRGPAVSDRGPLLLDPAGELVWMNPSWGEVMDFKVQNYKGDAYLTFWAGIDDHTHGRGNYFLVSPRCLIKKKT